MSGKTIVVHPDLFNYSAKKNKTQKKENKDIRIKVKNNNQTNKNYKKRILQELRERQEENMKNLFSPKLIEQPSYETEKTNDFNNSVDYLTSFTKEVEEKKQQQQPKNHTIKRSAELQSLYYHPTLSSFDNIAEKMQINDLDEQYVLKPRVPLPEPQWGCLKNGKLQTYRNWKQQTQKALPQLQQTQNNDQNISFIPTIMVNSHEPISNKIQTKQPFIQNEKFTQNEKYNMNQTAGTNFTNEEEKIKALSEIKQTSEKIKSQNRKKPRQLKQKRTIRRTYHIGKSKQVPKISVLVSNKTIRKNVTTKATLLKQTPINEIKRFLVKKGLIKVGSTAPNDVLRKIYESVSLIGGDVNNHNPDNLLYNYFNDQ
jgi:hypothetical protein